MPSESLIEKCCLIANPATGNATQYLVEQAFERGDFDWRFMTFEVEPALLGDAMRGIRALGFHGVKIGDPFQTSVAEHVDEQTETARQSGSINCIRCTDGRLVGDDTTVAAFAALVRQGLDPVGKQATVLGSGRMARVIAIALANAGCSQVTIAARNSSAGQQLVETLRQVFPGTSSFNFLPLGGTGIVDADSALLVNATSLGSTKPEAKLAFDTAALGPKLVVAELAYNTARTWLTTQAAQKGCRIIDGLSLYVEQTALALKAWTGTMPDTVAMREAAEEFLGL
ncbi:MAG: shikimate dehydrogenase [Pirellulales bacterium]|nr:shikimate dehydrogenase [Pirellulales bacterium]